ncbi:MAG TPA: hypothetical protein VM598_10250 [Bdellovibrionota bacterium]|nr:hypothetical protein [Bdellovibrionota bacterium]
MCTRDGKVVGPVTSSQLVEMRRTGAINEYFWVWETAFPQWMPANTPPPPPSPDATKFTEHPAVEAKTEEITIPKSHPQQQTPARSYARFDDRRESTSTHTSTSTSTGMTSEHYFPQAFGFDDEEEDDDQPKKVPDRPARHGRKRPAASDTTQEIRRILVVAHDRRHVINGALRHPSPSGALFLGPAPRSQSSGPFVRGNRIWINLFDASSGKSESVEVQVTSTIRRGNTWEYRVRWDKMPEILGNAA